MSARCLDDQGSSGAKLCPVLKATTPGKEARADLVLLCPGPFAYFFRSATAFSSSATRVSRPLPCSCDCKTHQALKGDTERSMLLSPAREDVLESGEADVVTQV